MNKEQLRDLKQTAIEALYEIRELAPRVSHEARIETLREISKALNEVNIAMIRARKREIDLKNCGGVHG